MRKIVIFALGLGVCAAIALGALFFITTVPWVNLAVLEYYDPGSPTIILDMHGKEIGRFEIDRRAPVVLSDVPEPVINAFVAAEDHRFFSHKGISMRGIVRSLLVNILRAKRSQGASTITQQLVRLLYFHHKKTYTRKIKEQFLAIAVERQFSKEHILESYLNHLYFGCGIYGVEAASKRFWNKSVTELTVDEAATLASIIPNPNRYCPLNNLELAQNRRNRVLKVMKSQGFIDAETFKLATAKPLTLADNQTATLAPHAKEYIRMMVEDMVGKDLLYTGGLVIQTTLNAEYQRVAETVFKRRMEELHARYGADVDGALLSIDVTSGSIRALIGGNDFASSQFNRVFNAYRQVGSTAKLIVFGAALENGFDFDDCETDELVTLEEPGMVWTPKNHNEEYEGTVSLAYAFARSKNTVVVKLLQKVGIQKVIECARRVHLRQNIQPYPSVVLGAFEATVLDVTAMFNVFANRGVYVAPHMIDWVKDKWGHKIYRHKSVTEQVLDWKVASKIAFVLGNSIERERARGTFAIPDDFVAFTKTGTTNQCRTHWYAGATPELTTVVYIGRDNNETLGINTFPRQTAFPIWLDYNLQSGQKKGAFEYEPSLKPVVIDPMTGREMWWYGPQNKQLQILKEKS